MKEKGDDLTSKEEIVGNDPPYISRTAAMRFCWVCFLGTMWKEKCMMVTAACWPPRVPPPPRREHSTTRQNLTSNMGDCIKQCLTLTYVSRERERENMQENIIKF